VAAADRLSYPVVVKPCHGGQGRAVAVHLTDAAQVAAAYRQASADRDSVVVEKFASGHDHRILVVDGRMVGAARRVPAHVVGDGQRSVEALVETLNLDPRRGRGYEKVLVRVEIDAEVEALLAGQGLTPASVPEAGRTVALKRTANVSTGGTAIDVIDEVHPDNQSILERAATAMELSIVGIDFLIEDIARSWREAGGVVLEANALPGLRPHWLAHPERSVAEPILRSLLTPGSDGRIPTCAITGTLGKTTTANMVARILGTMGLLVGRCTTVGVTVGDERQRTGDCASGWHARNLLFDRRVEAGVFELARGGLLNEGMTIEEVDVGAVLNVYDNHIGVEGIASRAGPGAHQVDRCAAGPPHARAQRRRPAVPRDAAGRAGRAPLPGRQGCRGAGLARPYRRGGCAVTLRGSAGQSMVVLADRGAVEDVMEPAKIPATLSGQHGGKVWNAMFAVAIAHAMGASLDHIRRGLLSFKPDPRRLAGPLQHHRPATLPRRPRPRVRPAGDRGAGERRPGDDGGGPQMGLCSEDGPGPGRADPRARMGASRRLRPLCLHQLDRPTQARSANRAWPAARRPPRRRRAGRGHRLHPRPRGGAATTS